MSPLVRQRCQNSTQAELIGTCSRQSLVMHLHCLQQYAEADPTAFPAAVSSICARTPCMPPRLGLAAGAAVTSAVGYGLYWLLTQGD